MAYDLRAFGRDLQRASEQAQREAEVVTRKVARDIQASAQQAAPVDTGALKSSITVEVARGTSGGGLGGGPTEQATTSAEIGPTVHYGGYVELGTSRHGPQPYLGPAFDRHAPLYEAALDQLVLRDLLR